jgi:hypothetical protein
MRRPTPDVRPFNRLPEPKVSLGFKIWFAICAVLGVAFLGLIAWAIIAIVEKVTR